MKIISLLISAFFCLSAVLAQDNSLKTSSTNNSSPLDGVPVEITRKVDVFFKTLINKKIDKAFEEFLVGSPLANKKDDIKNLLAQTQQSITLYGDLKGYDPISAQVASPSYIRVRYIALHLRFPMRWIFTFYRSPENGWMVTNIKFDDLTEYFFKDE
jgi:hypothetical protein